MTSSFDPAPSASPDGKGLDGQAPDGNEPDAPSISAEEVARFSALAEQWWDPEGPFKPLHRFNPARLAVIREQVTRHFDRDVASSTPFADLKVLDIGCGGGLLCEPMARLGATVTGIDASAKNIGIARLHAEQSKLAIEYSCTSAEAMASAYPGAYDVVLNMEVVEHVEDVAIFMQAACTLVAPGGMMVVATLSRTAKSFALAIVGAEYVLGWLPRGTHDWRKFLRPSEVTEHLERGGLTLTTRLGMTYHLLTSHWETSQDLSVNYMLVAIKDREKTAP